jgi:hypothetical protein
MSKYRTELINFLKYIMTISVPNSNPKLIVYDEEWMT